MLKTAFHHAVRPRHTINGCRLPYPARVPNRRAGSSHCPDAARPLLFVLAGPLGTEATSRAGLPSEGAGQPTLDTAETPPARDDLQVKALFWQRARLLLKSTHTVRVTVTAVTSEVLEVAFGPLAATLAWSHLHDHEAGRPALDGGASLVGRTLKAKIWEVNQLQDHLWLHDGWLEDAQGVDAQVEVGQVLTGQVLAFHRSGVFVALQSGRYGLLLPKDISSAHVLDAREHLSVGQKLKVFVNSTYELGGFACVALSTQQLELKPGDMVRDPRLVFLTAESVGYRVRSTLLSVLERARAKRAVYLKAVAQRTLVPEVAKDGLSIAGSLLKVGQVVSGVVQSVQPDGVLVDLGSNVTGLLHVSLISSTPVNNVQELFTVGQLLKVQISSIDGKLGRLSLSTKKLEPSPGDMLSNPQLVFDMAEEVARSWYQMV